MWYIWRGKNTIVWEGNFEIIMGDRSGGKPGKVFHQKKAHVDMNVKTSLKSQNVNRL